MRVSTASTVLGALGLILGAGAGVPAAAAAAVSPSPGQQRVTVTVRSYHSTYARLTGYRWSSPTRRWARVFGPWTARIGYGGLAPPGKKREGDGRTPSGTYSFGFFFGVLPNPGVAFPYRRARWYDVWDDDPASPRYNEWVDKRFHDPGASPEPMDQRPAYDYAAVIRYNAARVPGRGSAIFLHVGTGSATAGCVSLPEGRLLRIVRWLRPGRSPHIIIRLR